MTTVVVAPDGFKGSIRAVDAADAIAAGWRDRRPDDRILLRPMADGGEGTLDAFAAAVPGARRIPVVVTGPADVAVDAAWLLLPPTDAAPCGTAVVELAGTSGIELLGGRLLPGTAHTIGLGRAIGAALGHGVSRVVVALGSSASSDGGTGALTALGARFLDAGGTPIPRGLDGLASLATVDLTGLPPLPPGGVAALVDVSNPLLGPAGAAAVFGPQKGVVDWAAADALLARLASLLPADPEAPGAGAAGGTAFGLAAWGARLVPGSAEIAALVRLDDGIAAADLVITGEGAFDGQSAAGKAPERVRSLAAAHGVPVALVAGRIDADPAAAEFAASIELATLAGDTGSAVAEPGRWLRAAGRRLAEEALAERPSRPQRTAD